MVFGMILTFKVTADSPNGSRGERLSKLSPLPLRVQAVCKCVHGGPSESVAFTTLTCEPEPPNAPRKASGTKSALVLQWKVGLFMLSVYGGSSVRHP